MAVLFGGVAPQPSINKFILRSFLYDMRVPHTRNSLSPITVKEWLSRNNVIVLNTYDVYNAMNNVWRDWVKDNPLFITGNSYRSSVNLDAADEHVEGSWNLLIDYLMRLAKVESIADAYYKMHYIAICSHNFHMELMNNEELPEMVKNCYRVIWDQVINPILYEQLIPVSYDWLPIENWTDLQFGDDVLAMTKQVNAYIDAHRSGKINVERLDAVMLVKYHDEIETVLRTIVTNKHKDPSTWENPFKAFLSTVQMIDLDISLHDGLPPEILKMSGFYGLTLIHKACRLCKKYADGLGDADTIIDDLLGVFPRKEEYELAKSKYDKITGNDKKNNLSVAGRFKKFFKKFAPNGNKDGDDGHEAQHVKA